MPIFGTNSISKVSGYHLHSLDFDQTHSFRITDIPNIRTKRLFTPSPNLITGYLFKPTILFSFTLLLRSMSAYIVNVDFFSSAVKVLLLIVLYFIFVIQSIKITDHTSPKITPTQTMHVRNQNDHSISRIQILCMSKLLNA